MRYKQSLPPSVEIISLAKREEIVYSEKHARGIKLDVKQVQENC